MKTIASFFTIIPVLVLLFFIFITNQWYSDKYYAKRNKGFRTTDLEG